MKALPDIYFLQKENTTVALNTVNCSQSFGKTVLPGVACKLFQHNGYRHYFLLYREPQTQHFKPVNFDFF